METCFRDGCDEPGDPLPDIRSVTVEEYGERWQGVDRVLRHLCERGILRTADSRWFVTL